MQPKRPGRTRTAPPALPPKFPFSGRYRAYTLFDWTGLIYLLLGFLALRVVWALGSGEAAWNEVIADFEEAGDPGRALRRLDRHHRRLLTRSLGSIVPMKHLLLKFEPVIWLLFGQGILIGTLLLTGWVLVLGIAAPLGFVEPLGFAHAHDLGANPIGRLVLAALIVLPMWKGAHHMRHVFIDMGGGARDAAVAPALYSIALAGSVAGIVAVIRL
jgi:fumarate reductase subunit D